jgi:hypothetical protein
VSDFGNSTRNRCPAICRASDSPHPSIDRCTAGSWTKAGPCNPMNCCHCCRNCCSGFAASASLSSTETRRLQGRVGLQAVGVSFCGDSRRNASFVGIFRAAEHSYWTSLTCHGCRVLEGFLGHRPNSTYLGIGGHQGRAQSTRERFLSSSWMNNRLCINY